MSEHKRSSLIALRPESYSIGITRLMCPSSIQAVHFGACPCVFVACAMPAAQSTARRQTGKQPVSAMGKAEKRDGPQENNEDKRARVQTPQCSAVKQESTDNELAAAALAEATVTADAANQASTPIGGCHNQPPASSCVRSGNVKAEPHPDLGLAPSVTGGPSVGKSRAAIRASFFRSIPGRRVDPRITQGRVGDRSNQPNYAPHEIAVQIVSKKDEEWWLQVWCANDMSWGKVQTWVDKRKDQIKEGKTKYAFLTFDQMVDVYKNKAVAEGVKQACMKDPDRVSAHPDLPDDEAAMMFWCPVEHSQTDINRHTVTTGVTGKANLDGNSAALVMSQYNMASGAAAERPGLIGTPRSAGRPAPRQTEAAAQQGALEQQF